MNLPRLVAIVSAIVSSTAGFFVLSRWRLLGTFTGAAVVPVVYTLVSHFSNASLDRVERWLRSRRALESIGSSEGADVTTKSVERIAPGDDEPAALERAAATEVTEAPFRKRVRFAAQWALAVFAVLAFAVSLYSLVHANTGEKTIVRERIIEKTVTVTTIEYIYSSASAPDSPTSAHAGQSQTQPDTPTTEQTATTDLAGGDPDLSSTTTTTAAQGGGGDSSSTTSSTSSTTTLP